MEEVFGEPDKKKRKPPVSEGCIGWARVQIGCAGVIVLTSYPSSASPSCFHSEQGKKTREWALIPDQE